METFNINLSKTLFDLTHQDMAVRWQVFGDGDPYSRRSLVSNPLSSITQPSLHNGIDTSPHHINGSVLGQQSPPHRCNKRSTVMESGLARVER